MEDKLEKFVREHRTEFDTEEPRPELWAKIKSETGTSRVIPLNRYSWVWKAAAIFLFGLSAYLLVQRNLTPAPVEMAQANPDEFSLDEIEMHYTAIIEQKQVEIKKLGATHPELIKDFTNDIMALDSLYTQLHLEFGVTSNQRVLDAMIDNLKLRIEILNHQLAIIEKVNRKESEKTEIDDDTYKI